MATILISIIVSFVVIMFLGKSANACTRAVYLGPEDTIITVRSMDWLTEMETNLWAFPRGMARNSAAGENSLEWTSRYGSVIASIFENGSVDGINEQGLVVNMLYLTESVYPTPLPNDTRKPMSISVWVQYFLDNFATVAEAVTELKTEPFYVIPTTSPEGKPGTVHLSISDATGDSAIIEYVEGKLNIHHSREYQVMTNSPIYEHQLALNTYWQSIGGTTMLPGTNRAADRFVRASFYINAVTQTSDNQEAIAAAFSVIRNASVPRGISTPEQPNISSTIWRTVIDHKNRRYYFESTRSPNVFWVNLDDLDFTAENPVKKLTISNGELFAGNTAEKFEIAEPFEFLPATP